MVAEHSSIQSAMMLPELAALVVALGAMAFSTWWFSRNGDEKKKVQRNTVQGIPENISLYVTASGNKAHAKECNFVSCHDPRTGTRLMKHGVKNMTSCLACQPFSSANLVVEHETKPESSHARIFSACGKPGDSCIGFSLYCYRNFYFCGFSKNGCRKHHWRARNASSRSSPWR